MKTVFFDLDGTISDSVQGIIKCVQYTLHELGIEETDMDKLGAFVGPPLDDSFRKIYGMGRTDSHKAVEKYRERYHAAGIYECSLFEGVKEVLEHLKERGYMIALASSKPEESCQVVLAHLGVTQYFDVIAGATMDGRISSKEQVLRAALQRMHIRNMSETVLVGDTKYDVLGAKAVGMSCIGVTYGAGSREELEESGAAAVYHTIREVESYIEQH